MIICFQMKVVFVGDGAVGLSYLIRSVVEDQIHHSVPSDLENYEMSLVVDGRPVDIHIFHTTGTAEYDRPR